MGCFLVMTDRDLRQMRDMLKTAVAVVGGEQGGGVRIRVDAAGARSASEMAAAIRREARSTRVVADDGRPIHHELNQRANLALLGLAVRAPGLLSTYTEVARANYAAARAAEARRFGRNEGQQLAADMLTRGGYLSGGDSYTITTNKGIDILGRNNAGHSVVVEVKTSGDPPKHGNVGAKMSRGVYKSADFPDGMRQMDNNWLRQVQPGIDVDRTHLYCVFINTNTGKADLYRRASDDATEWKHLMSTHVTAAKLPPI